MTFLQRLPRLLLVFGILGLFTLARADDTVYTKVDENPVPLKTPPPKYPDSLKRDGISGVVAVSIVIDESGSIINSTVTKSSNSEFDRPALDAVRNWKFKPAKKDGNPVKVKVTVPLRFSINE